MRWRKANLSGHRAPENQFPIGINDCFDGLLWVSYL